MENFIKGDIFFFLTGTMVIVLIVIFIFAGYYLMQILKNFRDISTKLKNATDSVGNDFEDIHDQIINSWFYQFFFGKKNNKHKK